MRYLSTAEGDVLEAIKRLEQEAREYRRRAEASPRVVEQRVFKLKASKLEEAATYLRAHLP
jgi:hypothetical protein